MRYQILYLLTFTKYLKKILCKNIGSFSIFFFYLENSKTAEIVGVLDWDSPKTTQMFGVLGLTSQNFGVFYDLQHKFIDKSKL